MSHPRLRAQILGVLGLFLGAVASSADAGILYGAEVFGQERLVTIDRATAASTNIGAFGTSGPFGMTYRFDTSTMYMVDQAPSTKGLYTVNVTTGAAARVGVAGALGVIVPRGLAYDQDDGIMYTADLNTNTLYSLSLVTGVATVARPIANAGAVASLAFDDATQKLYAIVGFLQGSGGRHLVTINTSNGLATDLGSLPAADYRGLAFDSELGVLWTHNTTTGQLTKVNPANAALTPMGSTLQPGASGTSLNALAFVPAPGTFVLALGGTALAFRRRRG